jgi:anti-sigma factor RsiW
MSDTDIRACPRFLDEFTDFVDGALDKEREGEILAHLDCCEACLRHLRAYRSGVATYRGLDAAELDEDFYARLEECLRRSPAWGYLEPAPHGTLPPSEPWLRVPAAGVALVAAAFAVIWFSGLNEWTPLPSGGASDQPAVSIASVIPAVSNRGALAGEQPPRATRAAVAGREVPQVRVRRAVPDDPASRLRPTADLEREFAKFQARLARNAWAPPVAGAWVGPAGLRPAGRVPLSATPAAWVMEAALRIP